MDQPEPRAHLQLDQGGTETFQSNMHCDPTFVVSLWPDSEKNLLLTSRSRFGIPTQSATRDFRRGYPTLSNGDPSDSLPTHQLMSWKVPFDFFFPFSSFQQVPHQFARDQDILIQGMLGKST